MKSKAIKRVLVSFALGIPASPLLAATYDVDSVAQGFVVTDTIRSFDFSRLGITLLKASLSPGSPDASVVISPLSAGQALGLLLLAAKGSTASAISNTLQLGKLKSEDLAERTQLFNKSLRERHDVTLLSTNALWVDTSVTLAKAFVKKARSKYGAEIRSLPLTSFESMEVINHWADTATKGRIPGLVKQPFDSNMIVALMNATYFKGLWLTPFEKGHTWDSPFISADGKSELVPAMHKTASWAYRKGEGFRVLRLPYRSGLTALYLVLPDSGQGARDLLSDFEKKGWPLPDPRKEGQYVNLQLPRLHLEQDHDLQVPLKALGAEILFAPDAANFSNLLKQRPGQRPLCVDRGKKTMWGDDCIQLWVGKASQRIYLDVDEAGTEAAAVTSIGIMMTSTGMMKGIDFRVDHPFLFALRDERTGTFLFMGYVANPKQ